MNNKRLKKHILGIVNEQIKDNEPKCTRETFDRLVDKGYSEKEAKEMIGNVVMEEIFSVVNQQQPFNEERYCQNLTNLLETLEGVNAEEGIETLLERIGIFDDTFPKEELEQIISDKDEAIPELLNIMKDVRDNYEKYLEPNCFLHIYATYLLAQFKVKDFFEIIIDIVRLPGAIPNDLYGDTITEDLGRIIVSVYNGNIQLIHELIEDVEVDAYVRDQGIRALEILVLQGILERQEVVAYLKNLLKEKAEQKDYEIITGIINGLTDLYPEESMDEIKWAYEHDLVDDMHVELDDVLKVFNMGREKALEERRLDRHTQLIGHIADEIGWWHCFKEKKNKHSEATKKPKIGRNDPCPCGSGKKYKKCCLK